MVETLPWDLVLAMALLRIRNTCGKNSSIHVKMYGGIDVYPCGFVPGGGGMTSPGCGS